MAKILIADDDEEVRGLAEKALNTWGYDVVTAADADMAITLATDDPDVIILDYHMPGANGFTALTQIRRMGCKSPVIMLTADTSQKFIVQCFRAGADDFIEKPFDPEFLPITVNRALKSRINQRRIETISTEISTLKEALRSLYFAVTAEGCMICGEDAHTKACPAGQAGRILDRLALPI